MADPLDFSEIKFDSDPAPKESKAQVPTQGKTTTNRGTRKPPPNRKDAEKAEMAEEIQGFLMLLGMPLSMRDRHEDGTSCADMFIQYDPNKNKIEMTPDALAWSNAFAEIGIENKWIKRFFSMGDGASKWLTLAVATQPFVVSVLSNHPITRGARHYAGDSSLA